MRKRWFRSRWLAVVVTVLAVGIGTGIRLWTSEARTVQASALIGPHDRAVTAAETTRLHPDARVRNVTLTAAPATIRLGARTVTTWAFNGTVPGPEIRVNAGDILQARVRNQLSAPLTVHWHGVALRNDMDGVPDLTQSPIKPGGQFVYRFTVTDPGTFFYHSHVGTQLDRGLYGPLVVDDPGDTKAPRDVTVMLDDWVDGTGRTPDQILARLRAGRAGAMPGMSGSGMHGSMSDMPGMSGSDMHDGTADMPGMGAPSQDSSGMNGGMSSPTSPLGQDTVDTTYPHYLINGRTPSDPATYTAKPGERIRLRIINAASNTPFRVALGGSRLTVTASDGYPVRPVSADSVLVGMGERYDAVVTAPRSGAVPLVAAAEGTPGQALAVLRTGAGPDPMPNAKPMELSGRLLNLTDLHATSAVALPARTPDETFTVALTGDMDTYRWGIAVNGKKGATIPVRQGRRIRLVLENRTMMWHPIHLHGHTFQVVDGPTPGPRKDTVIVPPMGKVTIDLDANNPGQWPLHCHNAYHAEAGMMATLSYMR